MKVVCQGDYFYAASELSPVVGTLLCIAALCQQQEKRGEVL